MKGVKGGFGFLGSFFTLGAANQKPAEIHGISAGFVGADAGFGKNQGIPQGFPDGFLLTKPGQLFGPYRKIYL